MPGCGWGGSDTNPITVQSDSTSHVVRQILSMTVQLSCIWNWSAVHVARFFCLCWTQLFKLAVCQIQPSRLCNHLSTLAASAVWKPFQHNYSHLQGHFLYTCSKCQVPSCLSSIEMSEIIALTCEITTNTAVFTARFVKLRGFKSQLWKPGLAVHRGEALWLEAGGATGVTVLLWVTEICKQTMLGRTAACQCGRAATLPKFYMQSTHLNDAIYWIHKDFFTPAVKGLRLVGGWAACWFPEHVFHQDKNRFRVKTTAQ